jgi:selenocysteine-specific elongation factor
MGGQLLVEADDGVMPQTREHIRIYLHVQKKLIRLNNRRFMAPQAMKQIKERVSQVIERNGRLTVGDCKELLGYGRTVGVPVFEYLDLIGFTRRIEDGRVLV